jgi:hypothetical protein
LGVQIFATDIDEAMLQKARTASYPQSAVKDVPLELLDRYFYAQDDDYVLTQSVRDRVRVSNHNLIKDPPFSRVDMIVCRNLLIYFNANLQQRLIPVFHYALKLDRQHRCRRAAPYAPWVERGVPGISPKKPRRASGPAHQERRSARPAGNVRLRAQCRWSQLHIFHAILGVGSWRTSMEAFYDTAR